MHKPKLQHQLHEHDVTNRSCYISHVKWFNVMEHPFVIIYQINHPAILISILLSYSNRMMVIYIVLYNKLHFKILYILLGIYHVFCNAYHFCNILKMATGNNILYQCTNKDYTWKLFINISIILFYRSIKAIVILGIFSLFFLFVIIPFFFRWCSTLQRHMVFLPYGKIIHYLCLRNCLS